MDGLAQNVSQGVTSPMEDTNTTVRVWLFGALSALTPERPLVLSLSERFTVGDVVARLGDRLGDEPLDTGETAEIEFILMIAPEGG